MKRYLQISAALLSLVLPNLSATTFAAAPPPLKLTLNWKAEPQFGGFYNASLLGEFKKRGLEVEILEGGSGTPTVQMLANGKVDYAVVSAEEILISNERNPESPVMGIFAVYQTNPQMIMCHEEKGFQKLNDVFMSKGTLALQSGLTYAQYLKKKYPQMKTRWVPYAGGISGFVADTGFCQQGFATSEPLLAMKAGQKPKVFLIADEGFNPYTTVVAVRVESIKKNAAQIQKMVEALRVGWDSYLKDPMAANARMAEINKAMDAETFRRSAEAQVRLIQPTPPPFGAKNSELGKMTDARWNELGQQLQDLKVIQKAPRPETVYRNF